MAFLSATTNYERRKQVREKCFPEIKAKGLDVRFFVGRPSFITPGSHQGQGARATPKEIEVSEELEREISEYGDIEVVPFRDMYRDLTDKIAGIMLYALANGYENVLKIDDDQCANVDNVLGQAKAAGPGKAYYVGDYLWNGDEYPGMIGPDGSHHKYFSGVCYMLTGDLARLIFVDYSAHTLLFAPYGTDSDDANMGKWYAYAKEHGNADAKEHGGGNFTFKMVPAGAHPICRNIPGL